MSNQSSLKEGEQQMDEEVALVVEESQLEPALPPVLPPCIPSSSSSLLPSSSNDPSHTNVASSSSSSSGDPVAAQFAQLFSLVGRLSSENEALQAQVGVHSTQLVAHTSTIAQLSAENEELRKRDEEKTKTMEEMSKAFGDHWNWEAGRGDGEGGKGRWVWSGEKYKSKLLRVDHSKPPPSFDSLPVDLLLDITGTLAHSDILSLCRTSFGILEVVAGWIYGEEIILESRDAVSFVLGRLATTSLPEDRIGPLLLPRMLLVELADDIQPSDFDLLSDPSLDASLPLISINGLAILLDRNAPPSFSFEKWTPFFRLLNPTLFRIGHNYWDVPPAPEAFVINKTDLLFSSRWDRLHSFVGSAEDSIPLFQDGSLAFSECLRRSLSGEGEVEIDLVLEFKDGREEKTIRIEEEELMDGDLGDHFISTSQLSCVLFRARVVEEDGAKEEDASVE